QRESLTARNQRSISMANTTTNVRGKDEPRTGDFGQAGPNIMEKGKEAASTAIDKAKDPASSVARTASEAASIVGQKADDAASAVGSGMKSLAGSIRENAPREGILGSAGSSVARTLEGGGRYLQEEGLSGMMEDVTNLIRRNPLPALLIGIGIGFLLARTTSRRS